jgi:hypothetical protein
MLRSPTKHLVLPKLKILVALNISVEESHKESRDYNFSKFVLPQFPQGYLSPLGAPKQSC